MRWMAYKLNKKEKKRKLQPFYIYLSKGQDFVHHAVITFDFLKKTVHSCGCWSYLHSMDCTNSALFDVVENIGLLGGKAIEI